MLPSLPVKNSVLRRLGIADHELPYGLRRLKDNLLIPPSHTPSQESNICPNSDSDVHVKLPRSPRYKPSDHYRDHYGGDWFKEWLKITIAKSPRHPDPIETFKSLNYLDQIALACLATSCHDCQAPDCLQYRRKLEGIVPVCRSWPGLRDLVLCITSCSLRRARDINLPRHHPRDRSQSLGDEKSKHGLSVEWSGWEYPGVDLLLRFRTLIAVFIVLTRKEEYYDGWDIAGRVLEADNLVETDESGLSGSIGRPPVKWVSSRRCRRFTPEVLICPREVIFDINHSVGPAFITRHLILYKRVHQ